MFFLAEEEAGCTVGMRSSEEGGAYKKRFCKSRSMSSSKSLSNSSASMSSSLAKEGGAEVGTYRAGVFLL
jgi:hypothetical protein